MRMLPREQDRLLVFLAAELARKRRGRGLRLGQAEAVALISDETMEAARDGCSYELAEQRGYQVLGRDDVLPGVADIVDRIELEALFGDGSRLIVLDYPIRRDAPVPRSLPEDPPAWLESRVECTISNQGRVPVAVTSHFHLFEANRMLSFDRRRAWGMRLALPTGAKLVVEPAATIVARLVPIGGARIVRGHGGLVDGPLDAPGACDAALARARQLGYHGA